MHEIDRQLEPLRLTRCPKCDLDLSPLPPAGRCPQCRFRYDESTLAINGATATSGEFLALVIGWSTVLLLSLLLRSLPLTGLLAVGMGIHLALHALLGESRAGQLLVISNAGVALGRRPGKLNVLRWHLFDEVRIELIAEPAHDEEAINQPRWRLTLVNAYKPSISTYLHRRGTDAPIFAEAIVFTFHAPSVVADALRDRLREHVSTARRDYRALRLKEMHTEAPDSEDVFVLPVCPGCEHALAGLPADGQCPRCGRTRRSDMFQLPGRIVSPRPATVMLPAFALGLGLVYQLSGYPQLARWLLAVGAVAGVIWLATRLIFVGPRPRRVIVAANGLEIWGRDGESRVYRWWELPEFRTVQVEFGRWRMAFWDRPREAIRFSPFLFSWHAFPPGRPVLDVVILGDERTGRMICDEIERRRGDGEPAITGVSPSLRTP